MFEECTSVCYLFSFVSASLREIESDALVWLYVQVGSGQLVSRRGCSAASVPLIHESYTPNTNHITHTKGTPEMNPVRRHVTLMRVLSSWRSLNSWDAFGKSLWGPRLLSEVVGCLFVLVGLYCSAAHDGRMHPCCTDGCIAQHLYGNLVFQVPRCKHCKRPSFVHLLGGAINREAVLLWFGNDVAHLVMFIHRSKRPTMKKCIVFGRRHFCDYQICSFVIGPWPGLAGSCY